MDPNELIVPTIPLYFEEETSMTTTTTTEEFYSSENSCEDKITYAIFKSTNFSSKLVNYCELSGKYYNDDSVILQKLNGAEQLSNHHCYGAIQYHPENENLMKQANMYYEAISNIFCNHSWKGLDVKIERSSGQIMDTNIHENSCIRYFKNNIMFYIEFKENDELYNKWIPLKDYYSERRDRTDRGILSLNPDLYHKEIILYISSHPEWMNNVRKKWIELFTTEIEKTGIKVKLEYK